ncbi:5571_t:CDS:2 [Cetraspora pellucida]|uniref:5571_t:CDS:1 n=1 Tax=Cetraspora pellucida TaxID=1433469 RepID=A0ACA9K3U5_9GLOM|nr:5571_t:CDS:2 [Cetraspora pellucida]
MRRRASQNVKVDQQPPDIAYFGEIAFGDEDSAQKFDLIFDTRSAHLFVISTDCNSPACQEKLKYDQNNDKDFKPLNKNFKVQYDKGSASGVSGTTTIEIGGGFLVDNQEFGLVNILSDEFEIDEFEGMMGIALSSASENDQLTPITNLINNNALTAPQFSFMLGRITWSDLADNNKGHWLIPLDDCIVNDQESGFQNINGNIVTGTTLIHVPIDVTRTIYSKMQDVMERDNGRFYLFCDSKNVIGLKFKGLTWNIDVRDLLIKDGDECYGAIIGDNNDAQWVICDTFLKNVYSIFDQGTLQVGFGKLL